MRRGVPGDERRDERRSGDGLAGDDADADRGVLVGVEGTVRQLESLDAARSQAVFSLNHCHATGKVADMVLQW